MNHKTSVCLRRVRLFNVLVAMTLCLAVLVGQGVFASPAQARFLSFGVKDEAELGRKFNLMVRSRMPLIEDPEIADYIREMVVRLVRVMPPQPFDVTSAVVLNNALNAFAAPGGYVFVYSGIILSFQHEADLAGVLAHELAHVSQRHLAQRIERGQILSLASLLGMLGGIFLGGEGGGALVMGSVAGSQAAMLSYSRDNEREADQVGMNYLVAAGYNPYGLPRAFETIRKMKWNSGGALPAYMSTHPDVEERVGYLEERVMRLPQSVRERKDDDTRFKRIQTLLRARYIEPDQALAWFAKDKPTCLELMGRGIALDRQHKVLEAEAAFVQALACAPDDPLIQRETGIFYFKKGDYDRADPYLGRAVSANPTDLMALFYQARLLADRKNIDQASLYYERILAHLPEDAEVHQYYGRMLGENGKTFDAFLHLSYSAMYSGDRRMQRMYLQRAESSAQTQTDRDKLERFRKKEKERSEIMGK